MLTDKELEEIRRKMLELEEKPPVGSWQSIQAEVNPQQKWRPFWWLLPLLLLLIGVGTYQLMQPESGVSIEENKQLLSEGSPAPTVELKEPAEQLKQSAATALPMSEDGKTTLNKRPEDHERSTEQEVSQNVPELPIEALAGDRPRPAAIAGGRLPEVPFVAAIPTKAPGVATAIDSTDREPQQVVGRKIIPVEAISLLAVKERKAAKAKAAKTRKNNATGVEPGITETTTVSLTEATDASKKRKAFSKATPTDSAATDAEKNPEPAPKKDKVQGRNEWAAGVYFAPRYAFRKFVPNASDNILITEVSSANQLDPERMGFEFGTNFSRKLANRLFVEGGLSWIQLKENVAYTLTTGKIDSFNVSQLDDGQVEVEPMYSMEERQLISSYAYGGLRLGATYYFMESGSRRLNVTVAGGANLLVKGRTKQYSNGAWTETVVFPSKENILEQSNYNLQFGVGYNVAMLSSYEITLMPTFNYFLGSTFKEREPLGLKPYSLGLNIQLKRRFNQ